MSDLVDPQPATIAKGVLFGKSQCFQSLVSLLNSELRTKSAVHLNHLPHDRERLGSLRQGNQCNKATTPEQ